MSQPILSVLIPTVIGRERSFGSLIDEFRSQIGAYDLFDVVEVMVARDNKEITIGKKRENLYKFAKGLYSVQWDDDDFIHPKGLQLIVDALKSNPEIPCVTYKESCMMNGIYKSSNHSITYFQWMDNSDGYDYVRCPFYKDVIRTDIARLVPFPDIRYNEDEQWSMALREFLNAEIHINEEVYH